MVPPANCFTVLVIDDMPANRVLLRKVLNGAGYAVLEATNGDDALALLEGRALLPDLIVTDIEMPGSINGVGLAQWIKDNRPALPVVLTSGRQSAALPGVSFLLKPYSLGELLPIIEGAGTRA